MEIWRDLMRTKKVLRTLVLALIITVLTATGFVSSAAGAGAVYNGLFVSVDFYPEHLEENMMLVQKGDYCYPYWINLFRNGKLEGRIRTTEGTYWIQSSEEVVMNEWNKVVMNLSEGHLVLLLNGELVAEATGIEGELVDRDTYTTMLGNMGNNSVSLNGFEVHLFYYDSSSAEVPNEPAHPMEEQVNALMARKGWDQDENVDLIEGAVYRIMKAATVLSDEEIIDRLDSRIQNLVYNDNYTGFWGDTLEMRHDEIAESAFVRSMLYALCQKEINTGTSDSFTGFGFDYQLEPMSFDENMIDEWFDNFVGNELTTGFTCYLMSKAYEEDVDGVTHRYSNAYNGYLLCCPWPESLNVYSPDEVSMTMPMIYLIGSEEMEQAYFGTNEDVLALREAFDNAYGPDMFDQQIINQRKFINMVYNGQQDPDGIYADDFELIANYTDVLVDSMFMRYWIDQVDETAMAEFRNDYESFLMYLPIIEGAEYSELTYINENIQQ